MCWMWWSAVFAEMPSRSATCAGGQAEREQPQHLRLAGGEPGRQGGAGGAAVAGGDQDPLDRLAVEPAGAAHGAELGAAASRASAARCGRSEIIAW